MLMEFIIYYNLKIWFLFGRHMYRHMKRSRGQIMEKGIIERATFIRQNHCMCSNHLIFHSASDLAYHHWMKLLIIFNEHTHASKKHIVADTTGQVVEPSVSKTSLCDTTHHKHTGTFCCYTLHILIEIDTDVWDGNYTRCRVYLHSYFLQSNHF